MSNLEFDNDDLDVLVDNLLTTIHKNTDENDLHSINSLKCKNAIKEFLSKLNFKVEIWIP
jgi:hypothetical protein